MSVLFLSEFNKQRSSLESSSENNIRMRRQQEELRLDADVEENEQRLVYLEQTLLVTGDDPEEWRPGVDQQDPEPVYIKEEQEELWTSLEGEQLNEDDETDVTRSAFTTVAMKCENEEEKPRTSQIHQHQMEDGDDPVSCSADQMRAECSEEDCGGAETYGDVSSSPETEMSEDYEVDQDGSNPDGPKTDDRDDEWDDNKTPDVDVNTVNKSVSCSECGKQFLHKGSLQRHLTTTRSSSCSVKTKRVRVKNQVDSCRKIQTREEAFSFDECGENSKKDLNRHERVQTEQKPFVCDVCGHRFKEKASLNRHTRIHTLNKHFVCDVCGNGFNQKTSLNRHMRIHTEQKPFVCDVCGNKFNHKTNLNTHMRTHTEQKPFACDVCGNKFSQKANLNTHMRTHTGKKPFACDVCGHRFSHKTSLNAHIRSHTGQKPFACDDCGNKFSHKTSLKTHMRIHTGQKPFTCDVCGHRFSQKINLNTHMRIHTEQKPFACDVCGHRFNQKINLHTHLKCHTKKVLIYQD